MDEIIRQALGILRGMWKFRWPAIIVAWLVAGVSAWQTFRIPDQYQASARVYVDTDSILKPLMSGLTVQPNVQQQLAMLSRTLLSRPNMERLVRMADLDLGITSQEQRDALVDSLARRIVIGNSGADNLYTLSFRDQDQEKAKRVIQSFVSMFVESSLGNTRKDTDSAKNFLNEQIRVYESKLEEAEAKVKAFRVRNLELQTSEGGGDAAGRVRAAQVALQQAQLELREAENARNAARAQLDAERSQSQSAGTLLSRSLMQESSINIATPEIDARLEAQRRALDALTQRFTDQHPDVIITRRTIRELEEQKAVQMAALRQAAMAAPQMGSQGATSPVIQEMQRILASTEVQVAQLKARVSEFSGRLAAAREGLKTAPELEAEQAQLNRDYGIIRRTYDELVARRQQAIMSGELDSAAGVAEFRLIDPPRVSPKPVAPNRFAMLPGALFLGFGAGLGLAFVLSQLRPVFHDGNDLRIKTGVPLLGVVSMRLDDVQRKRERRGLVGFASAVGGLLGAFGVGLALIAAFG
jgi:polysaccharide chain length determinant protein (PEP-CTERM system associated)